MDAVLREAPTVTASGLVAGLTIAILAISAMGANAGGGFWFLDAEDYPPIYAPAYDPRRGPVWTPNGWSYPQWADARPRPYLGGARDRVFPGDWSARRRAHDRDPGLK